MFHVVDEASDELTARSECVHVRLRQVRDEGNITDGITVFAIFYFGILGNHIAALFFERLELISFKLLFFCPGHEF
jgi:hypothetical protein